MARELSTCAKYTLANEITPAGRRLFQLSRMRRNERSYQLFDEFGAFTGIGRAVVDGEMLERGWVREILHHDHTRSYVLTPKGRAVATHIANHIGALP